MSFHLLCSSTNRNHVETICSPLVHTEILSRCLTTNVLCLKQRKLLPLSFFPLIVLPTSRSLSCSKLAVTWSWNPLPLIFRFSITAFLDHGHRNQSCLLLGTLHWWALFLDCADKYHAFKNHDKIPGKGHKWFKFNFGNYLLTWNSRRYYIWCNRHPLSSTWNQSSCSPIAASSFYSRKSIERTPSAGYSSFRSLRYRFNNLFVHFWNID